MRQTTGANFFANYFPFNTLELPSTNDQQDIFGQSHVTSHKRHYDLITSPCSRFQASSSPGTKRKQRKTPIQYLTSLSLTILSTHNPSLLYLLRFHFSRIHHASFTISVDFIHLRYRYPCPLAKQVSLPPVQPFMFLFFFSLRYFSYSFFSRLILSLFVFSSLPLIT